jgi:hypothetical protein
MASPIWWHPWGCTCLRCELGERPPTPEEAADERRAEAFGRDVRGGMAYSAALAKHYPDDPRLHRIP